MNTTPIDLSSSLLVTHDELGDGECIGAIPGALVIQFRERTVQISVTDPRLHQREVIR